jgi:hypothetical protein
MLVFSKSADGARMPAIDEKLFDKMVRGNHCQGGSESFARLEAYLKGGTRS